MARKVHSTEVEIDGETRTVYYRKPSGALMLKLADQQKADKLTNAQSAKDIFLDCLCKDESGTPADDKFVQEIIADTAEFTTKLQLLLAGKKADGEEKNA